MPNLLIAFAAAVGPYVLLNLLTDLPFWASFLAGVSIGAYGLALAAVFELYYRQGK